jgi:hypothetical protein
MRLGLGLERIQRSDVIIFCFLAGSLERIQPLIPATAVQIYKGFFRIPKVIDEYPDFVARAKREYSIPLW